MATQNNNPAHVSVWSAGGVVMRNDRDGETETVICHRTGSGLWALPKGTPNRGETEEATALREVQEETGLEVRIKSEIGTIAYSFARSQADNPRYAEMSDGQAETIFDKTVRFYLMEPTGGDVSAHDHEFDAVIWTGIQDAIERLTHESEAGILEKALAIFEGRAGGA